MFNSHIYTQKSFPHPLSLKETEECLKLFKEGDLNARKKLIERNLRLVAHIVKKYSKNGIIVEDLISVGSIGLIKAIDNFDISKNIKLATYASRCIENEILMYLRKNKGQNEDISLNQVLGENSDGSEFALSDTLSSDYNIEDDYIRKETCDEVKDSLVVLNEREKIVIQLRYGFIGEGLTQAEIANMLKLSRSYISRIERSAMIKINDYLSTNGIQAKKRKTKDMRSFEEMTIDERTLLLANTILSTNLTVEQISRKYNVSVNTIIHHYFQNKLLYLNSELYEKVINTLNEQRIYEKGSKKIKVKKPN